ncbi:hypothetical protein [Halomonas nitroreducens]|uniref:Sulfotransferase domain-containing protein n=1 Tax=Halomonas nitroreducens TaxID=447425 RepID=A0A431UYA0_9GAMM|nr:hypothetical protein [Halomonas nitroreducens]RTQ97918.1 hypothetical protein EKG36_19590 [Halomonas nitroreducens]
MRKIVHIGQMKSGTTYIQNSFHQNREELYRQGYLYPGSLFNHQHACYGICGSDIPWIRSGREWEQLGSDLVGEINSSGKDVILSAEALSCMNEKGIASFIEKINGVDKVVITVRNFHRVILSAWQQSIKGGGIKSLPEFIHHIGFCRSENIGMWKNYSFGDSARIWAKHAPVDIIVANGNQPSSYLLEKFCESCGVGEVSEPKLDSSQENKSLKREDAELLRSLNILNKEMPKESRYEYIRWLLKKGLFPAASLEEGSKIKIPEGFVKEISGWAEDEIEKIPKEVEIIGDINGLAKINSDDVDKEGAGEGFDVDHLSRFNLIAKLIFKNS